MRRSNIITVVETILDHDWRRFVEGIRKANAASNERMFKILTKIKGEAFVSDVKKLRKKSNIQSIIRLTRQPKGVMVKDKRYPNLPRFMMHVNTNGDFNKGHIYIQITEDRWIYFHY